MKKQFVLRDLCLFFCFLLLALSANAQTVKDSTINLFNIDTVAKNLGFPWEILHGPDDSLWITEARGYRVVRISKSRTGAHKNIPPQQVMKIPLGSSQVSFSRSIGTWPQGGMQGMVLHPEFKTGKPWVYLSYVYSGTCPGSPSNPCYFRTKIVRCRFYFAADAGNPSLRIPKQDSLVILDTVISNLPGSNDHNSGRLVISPVKEINPGIDTTYKLYYTIGDMGAGQFANASRPNHAQTRDTCEGKILRLNTEPDADVVPGTIHHDFQKYCRWIPNDNPFTHSIITGFRTPIYSWGHRNAQGVVWGNVAGTWRLYSSEHGDKSDDEVNIIEAGSNYGWPRVAGMHDNNYSNSDAYANNNILAGQTVTWSESGWAAANNAKRPMFSFFNWPADSIPSGGSDIFTWPTIGTSSIDFYNGNIPGWKNSLLVISLKYGMFRLKLNAAGTFADSTISTNRVDTFPFLHGWRVRDIAINRVANSGQFWVAIDSSGNTSGPTGGFSGVGDGPTKDGGKILKLTYKSLIVLPVNFITFSGRLLDNNQAALEWKAEADEHSWFEIERSVDKQNFVSIGRVEKEEQNFTDKLPFAGNNYYRIKAVSKDGRSSYTNIIHIPYRPAYFTLEIYPNPVKNLASLRFNCDRTTKILLEVTDVTGRSIYSEDVNARPGTQEIQIDISSWPSQVYVVKAIGADGKVLSLKKFVKQ